MSDVSADAFAAEAGATPVVVNNTTNTFNPAADSARVGNLSYSSETDSTSKFYTDEDLAKVRSQEKDKLYPQINALKEEIAALKKEREEKAAARANPGLTRGLYAIQIGLRSEGVREWNYTTNLHQGGGMGDRELLAAADLACERQVWDRCINTSERMRNLFDAELSFPMPFREEVIRRTREIDLDPAYVYGLIRQESRFVMDARSHVGAAGLMQVMPATAKWTARKIGLENFKLEQLNRHDTNIAIGTGYLKLVLDSLGGSMPLAAAAYNAGPSRARKWSQGRVLEGAIWAENVPFQETRDYVKKVLSNATLYAAIITAQPQSLSARLGMVGPQEAMSREQADIP